MTKLLNTDLCLIKTEGIQGNEDLAGAIAHNLQQYK
jgi:glycerate-2-kinase